MFGHQSNNDQATASHQDQPADDAVSNGIEPETVSPSAADAVPAPAIDDAVNSQPNDSFSQPTETAGTDYVMTDLPPANDVNAASPAEPVAQPTADDPIAAAIDSDVAAVDDTAMASAISAPAVPAPVVTPPPTPVATPAETDDLLSLKQSALQDLTPLLGELEQTPEEKFRTTMMMIQASDDQSLLQTAYEAAKSITEEKARAQALLDVVNEINYFTQQSDTPA